MKNTNIDVNISTQCSYTINITDIPIKEMFESISNSNKNKKILVIIDKNVNKLYSKFINIDNSIKFVLKSGEKEKNFKNYQKIIDFALKNKLERKDLILSIGGGVCGDLSGFVASTYLRGINIIQIPTTLLACVDSSVGGKTAINTKYGKNLVGTFFQPNAVFCNINFLESLNERQFKTGLAEVVKYAFIEKSCKHNEYFNLQKFLIENFDSIMLKNKDVLTEIIRISIELKKSVVSQDEKENNLRRILNFGHTFGHAIERITNYTKYTHGEAVTLGMIFAFELAFNKEFIDYNYKNDSIEFIKNFNIINKFPKLNNKKIVQTMHSDKKAQDGKIKFIMPSCAQTVDVKDLDLDNFSNHHSFQY